MEVNLQEIVCTLQTSDQETAFILLQRINTQLSNLFEFKSLTPGIKKDLFAALQSHVSNSSNSQLILAALELIKILSRDKENNAHPSTILPERALVSVLIHRAQCSPTSENEKSTDQQCAGVVNAAQKCLCNFIFQCPNVRQFCIDEKLLTKIQGRLNQAVGFADEELLNGICFYDLRLSFLLTALCPETRSDASFCQDARIVLTKLLRRCEQSDDHNADLIFDGPRLDVVCEILKTAFNISMPCKMADLNGDDEENFAQLTMCLRNMFFVQCSSEEKYQDLLNNVVNLLTAVPSKFYPILIPAKPTESDIFDFSTIDVLLNFLRQRLDAPVKEQKELLSPILTLLSDMARTNKHLRRYLRSAVLPPLRDVSQRPEAGNTLRNKLVKLMTSITDINITSAEFLFYICNCNVARLIKYTGFGNAAGVLAHRGLLAGGGAADRSSVGGGDSSGSDSDTEEYVRASSSVNPVLGCVDPKLNSPSPMAGMSDEQKEYEAIRLVNEIDKLINRGVVVPGRVGDDGKVHPIEHVLQLQESSIKHPNRPAGTEAENEPKSSSSSSSSYEDRDR